MLHHICDYACQKKLTHLTKALDRVRIDTDRCKVEGLDDGVDMFAVACSKYVADQSLGIVVKLLTCLNLILLSRNWI